MNAWLVRIHRVGGGVWQLFERVERTRGVASKSDRISRMK